MKKIVIISITAACLWWFSNIASDLATVVIKMLLLWACGSSEARKRLTIASTQAGKINTHTHTHVVHGININQALLLLKLTGGTATLLPERKIEGWHAHSLALGFTLITWAFLSITDTEAGVARAALRSKAWRSNN